MQLPRRSKAVVQTPCLFTSLPLRRFSLPKLVRGMIVVLSNRKEKRGFVPTTTARIRELVLFPLGE